MNQGNAASFSSELDNAYLNFETPTQRVTRLCRSPGGALVGWLMDEARRRGQDLSAMALDVGVTSGYILQLKLGLRLPQDISHDFAVACASYLGVPPVVVKLVSGSLRLQDFAFPQVSEEELVDRGVRSILDDPQIRAAMPGDLLALPLDVKKLLVMMYAETSGQDLFGARQLPNMLRWLQRAAVIHAESEFEARVGHRDTSASLPG